MNYSIKLHDVKKRTSHYTISLFQNLYYILWPCNTIIPICDTDDFEIGIPNIGVFVIPMRDIGNIEILI